MVAPGSPAPSCSARREGHLGPLSWCLPQPPKKETQMTRYIGLDAHSESCTIAVLGASGKRPRHERIQTSAERLRSIVQEVPRPRHLCMEEGTLSEWLCEELAPSELPTEAMAQ